MNATPDLLLQLDAIDRGLSMLRRMAAQLATKIRRVELERRNEAETVRSKAELATRCVAAEFGVTYGELMGRGRERDKAEARQTAMWLLKKKLPMSACAVARFFKRNHSMVPYSVERVKERIETESTFADRLLRLIAKVNETLSANNERKP